MDATAQGIRFWTIRFILSSGGGEFLGLFCFELLAPVVGQHSHTLDRTAQYSRYSTAFTRWQHRSFLPTIAMDFGLSLQFRVTFGFCTLSLYSEVVGLVAGKASGL